MISPRPLIRAVLGLGLCVFTFLPSLLGAQVVRKPGRTVMKTYETKYYIIHSDLPPDDVKEASLRMTKMAEEYHERTKGFSGAVRERLPFYLFSNRRDYYAAGGLPGSAGVFEFNDQESRLMAIAVDNENGGTWHVVQHEGFHQFAHAVIAGDLPPWLNEGIAEYFGEALFTGDGFVSGVIRPRRLAAIQQGINAGRFKHIPDMAAMSHAQWSFELSGDNYDQAWSMVHFLIHGENGKYRDSFSAVFVDIGRKKPWDEAWNKHLGSFNGMEEKWSKWWLDQPKNPTVDLYARATVSTLTSYLARATMQKQTFEDFDAFLKAANEGELKAATEDWLPPSLLKRAMKAVGEDKGTKWALEPDVTKSPTIVAILKDGTRIVGGFPRGLKPGKVSIMVDVDDLPATLSAARALIAEGKKAEARTRLQEGLRKHPKSPAAEDVRKLLGETK
ncbi:MAG: hypothetical protein JWN51_903 [Phycisphaerales bacterium]|nr:hypothetical protein [Phycisphaerales bacterium]